MGFGLSGCEREESQSGGTHGVCSTPTLLGAGGGQAPPLIPHHFGGLGGRGS